MKTFKVRFNGRTKVAIGITYEINTTVRAPKNSTEEEIRLKLYDNYELIRNLTIENI